MQQPNWNAWGHTLHTLIKTATSQYNFITKNQEDSEVQQKNESDFLGNIIVRGLDEIVSKESNKK